MKEIGSEFWDTPTREQGNDLFPEFTHWFLSGRSALQSIIKELGTVRTVSLPAWCCDCMVKPFADAKCSISFYPVFFEGGTIVQDFSLDSDVLLLMDYFGYTASSPDLSTYKGIVIRDVTHSLFSATYTDADYYFGSLRKWCGVWTGGFAWTSYGRSMSVGNSDAQKYVSLRREAMRQKEKYIHSRDVLDKAYLKMFGVAEEMLEDAGIAPAADRDVNVAKLLDIDGIRNRRRENAALLMGAFPDWLVFPRLSAADCPLFVPVLVPNGRRDALRKHLIQNQIYCPVHWPLSQYHTLDSKTEYIYQNELSLICDQRYKEEDMHRLIDAVNLFRKEA